MNMDIKGNIFTWQPGNSMETLVKERLDRCLASNGWCSLFPYLEVIPFPIYESDHASILLLKFGEDKSHYKKGKFVPF